MRVPRRPGRDASGRRSSSTTRPTPRALEAEGCTTCHASDDERPDAHARRHRRAIERSGRPDRRLPRRLHGLPHRAGAQSGSRAARSPAASAMCGAAPGVSQRVVDGASTTRCTRVTPRPFRGQVRDLPPRLRRGAAEAQVREGQGGGLPGVPRSRRRRADKPSLRNASHRGCVACHLRTGRRSSRAARCCASAATTRATGKQIERARGGPAARCAASPIRCGFTPRGPGQDRCRSTTSVHEPVDSTSAPTATTRRSKPCASATPYRRRRGRRRDRCAGLSHARRSTAVSAATREQAPDDCAGCHASHGTDARRTARA